MAIFQPTNITPSTFAGVGGGVVDAAADVSISWQVNGNSPMTGFTIDVFENTAEATTVHSQTVTLPDPFYGTDSKGRPIYYVYTPGVTWNSWGLYNGESYKFRITQSWKEIEVAKRITSADIESGSWSYSSKVASTTRLRTNALIPVTNGMRIIYTNPTLQVYFGVLETPTSNSFLQSSGWINSGNVNASFDIGYDGYLTFTLRRADGTDITTDDYDCKVYIEETVTYSVSQNTENVFVTRSTPTLSVSPVSGTTITSVGQTFTATYAQANGDAVNWIRWILTDSADNRVDDTGAIYTQQLSYTFDRFFDGETYTLVCIVETETGVQVTAIGTYAVSYASGEASGEISVTCNPDDSVTLHWAKAASIPGTPSPATGWGTAVGGELNLNPGATVTWDTINPGEEDEQQISVSQPYIAGWRGTVGTTDELTGSGSIALSAEKAPSKLYPGTGTATETVTAGAMALTPQPDLTGTGTISEAVTSSQSLVSQISYAGGYSTIEPGPVVTEIPIPDEELESLGFTYYMYRGTDDFGNKAYKTYLSWTSYIQPTGYTRLSGATPTQLTSYARFDSYGTKVYDNRLYFDTNSVSDWQGNLTTKPFTVKITYRYYQYTGTYTPDGDHSGLNSITITSLDPALRATGAPFAPQIKTSATDENGAFKIVMVASEPGTYSMDVQYKYAYEGSDAYEGSYSGVFDAGLDPVPWERGQLLSAVVSSVTPATGQTASATVSVGSDNSYVVTFRASSSASPSAAITFTYNSPYTGNDSFTYTTTINLPTNAVGGIEGGALDDTNATGGYTMTQTGTRTYKLTLKDKGYDSTDPTRSITYQYNYDAIVYDAGSALTLGGTPSTTLQWAAVSGDGARLTVSVVKGGVSVGTLRLPVRAWFAAFTLKNPASGKDVIKAYSWDRGGNALSSVTLSQNSMLPTPVTSVTLTGEQTANWVALSKDSNANFIPSPEWTSNMVLFARFQGTLEAGTLASGGDVSVMIYREQDGAVEPVGLMETNVTQITDYGIRSGSTFRYVGYYVTSGTYSSGMVSEEVCLKLRKFTLVEAEPDAENPNTYHPVRVFSFRANIDGGTYSNANAPVLLDNFTAYPLRQPSPKNALTGTLTGLLGYFENGEYVNDTVALAKAVHALSVSDNPLFLRDMKGNMFMVGTSGSITSTINNMTGAMPTTVSIPWVEIGDADAAMIYTIDEAV